MENDRDKLKPDQYIFHRSYLYAKRLIDVVCSLTFLLLLSPIFIGIAVAIKLDSPGPVFIRSLRIGRWGLPFNLYKFRTMVPEAREKMIEFVRFNMMNGPVFKMRNDPRATRVGRFLRRTSLDELPQLWNVLKGEMTLVGPRPALSYEVDALIKENSIRLRVVPGITGLWLIGKRTGDLFKSWNEADLQYCKNMSLWLDLKIIVRTIHAVLIGEGAM